MKTLALLLALWLAVAPALTPALAGTRIEELSAVDTLAATDQVPVYDASNDDTRKASMTVIAAYVSTVLDAQLLALAGISPTADTIPYFTSSTAAAVTTLTAFMRTLLDDADATAARATLGVVIGTHVQAYDADLATLAAVSITAAGTALLDDANAAAQLTTLGISAYAQTLLDDANAAAAQTTLGISAFAQTILDDANAAAALATLGVTAFAQTILDDANAGAALTTLGVSAFAQTILDDANAAAARTTLGVVIGTDVQAFNAILLDLAGLTQASDALPYFDSATTAATTTLTAFGRSLIDDANAAAAQATLGVPPNARSITGTDGLSGGGDLSADRTIGIANDGVTYARMQNVSAASRLLGRGDSGAGDPQELTVGSGLTISGTELSMTGGGFEVSSVSGGYVTRSGTNLLFAPENSNRVFVYESSAWTQKTIPDAGITVACTGLTNDTDYYLYVYDSAGTLTLDLSTTATTSQNGILVKSGATSRLLIARCRSNGSGAITTYAEDAATQLVCNTYNKRTIALTKQETTASWTYQGNWRSLNNSTANRLQFVSDGKDCVRAHVIGVGNHASQTGSLGIGVDSTSVNSSTAHAYAGPTSGFVMSAMYSGMPAAGFHYLQALEATFDNSTGAFTFRGRNAGGAGGQDYYQITGIACEVRA